MSYPKLPFVLLPVTRAELPGWGPLSRLFGVMGQPGSNTWMGAPTVEIRGKTHGFEMQLDLSDWAERMTYFLGRYYELPQQLLFQSVLELGDRVVDIGGNIGMVTLVAARAVGRTGVVETFEPNPDCLARLRGTIARNAIDWVKIHPYGVSDEPGALELTVFDNHSGVGTFAPVSAQDAAATKRMKLELVRADDVLARDPRPIKLIKIDVEGFETKALKGLLETLKQHHPMVVVETVEAHLRRAGSSADEMFGLLLGLGYKPYALSSKRDGVRHRLQLVPLSKPSDIGSANDVLWVHPQGPRVPPAVAAMLSR
jgi:FkbM family methyltransferase